MTKSDDNKIENFGNDRVKNFNFIKFTKGFKFKNEKLNKDFKVKEKSSVRKLFTKKNDKKNDKKNSIDFPSGYGEYAKLL